MFLDAKTMLRSQTWKRSSPSDVMVLVGVDRDSWHQLGVDLTSQVLILSSHLNPPRRMCEAVLNRVLDSLSEAYRRLTRPEQDRHRIPPRSESRI